MAKDRDRIELIARGVLLYEGRLLLCRNRGMGHAFLPGGHVEFGEQARTALQRELNEETGVDLVAGDFVGVCESQFRQSHANKPDGRVHHEVNLVFALQPTAGRGFDPNQVASREEHIDFIWESTARLIGSDPAVTILPVGIIALVETAAALASTAPRPASALPRWITNWP